ncbi:MAG: hypothetical protein ABIM50_07710, partial [Novosphingobium sp.]
MPRRNVPSAAISLFFAIIPRGSGLLTKFRLFLAADASPRLDWRLDQKRPPLRMASLNIGAPGAIRTP